MINDDTAHPRLTPDNLHFPVCIEDAQHVTANELAAAIVCIVHQWQAANHLSGNSHITDILIIDCLTISIRS